MCLYIFLRLDMGLHHVYLWIYGLMESYDEDSDVHQQIYSIYAITIYIYTYTLRLFNAAIEHHNF